MVNLKDADIDADYLITCKEFMSALQTKPPKRPAPITCAVEGRPLFERILPRSLSFSQVLRSAPIEAEFNVSDIHMDDFLMFRYELQTINKKHYFADEKGESAQMFGRHPLASYEGIPIKEVLERVRGKEGSKNKDMWNDLQQMYIPPGVVRTHETSIEKPMILPHDIRSAIPKSTMYKRVKMQRSISTKTAMFVSQPTRITQMPAATPAKLMKATSSLKPQQEQIERNISTAPAGQGRSPAFFRDNGLEVQTTTESANVINFEKLFQDQLPLEAVNLGEFLRKYKEKDESQEFDITSKKRAANDKLEWCCNILEKGEENQVSPWMLADAEVFARHQVRKQRKI